ncbi:AGAP006434-PA-like protein [Anopheles sinensis]|uniref:AGAP006434-PA-like protein n=1 Tax=Anopheles sinensis TaxID=74873 RepID=A0A084VCV2_ANOSI|nr:AGAP006434-PA-like protein [Anopheles sinensis]
MGSDPKSSPIKFYECRQKDAYEMECPEGLHFNSRLEVCDYPQNAQCVGGEPGVTTAVPVTTTTTPGTTTTTSAPNPEPVTPTTAAPNPVPVTTTTAAPNPQPVTTTTAAPNPVPVTTTTAAPNPEPVTTPFPPGSPPTTPTIPTVTPPGFPSTPGPTVAPPEIDPHCPMPGAAWPNYWAHDYVCSKYLACWEGCVQEFTCPFGTFWNNALQACVYSNSHCTCPAIPPAPVLVPTVAAV